MIDQSSANRFSTGVPVMAGDIYWTSSHGLSGPGRWGLDAVLLP
jgi:hypothetical protein